jgi:polar amino acid transport system substrate-binding protein
MPKQITIALLCLILICCSGLPAPAASLHSLVYVTENFKPYNYLENGETKGLAVDLLRLVWQQLGIKPQKINVYPWARGYLMLQFRPNVVLFTTARTFERENQFKWAGPITKHGQRCVFVAKKSRNIHLETLADANAYRIGTIREDYAEQVILKMGIDRTSIESVSTMLSNLNKIQANRIDLIAYTENAIFEIIESSGFNRNDFESVYLITEVFPCYAFSKAIPDRVIKQFQDTLEHIKQSPEYPDLLKKYKME